MKIGSRVYLKFSPEHTGTVTALRDGEFRVTWGSPDRKPGKPRARHWYTLDALSTGMKLGVPEA